MDQNCIHELNCFSVETRLDLSVQNGVNKVPGRAVLGAGFGSCTRAGRLGRPGEDGIWSQENGKNKYESSVACGVGLGSILAGFGVRFGIIFGLVVVVFSMENQFTFGERFQNDF